MVIGRFSRNMCLFSGFAIKAPQKTAPPMPVNFPAWGETLLLLLLQEIPDQILDEFPAFSAAGTIAGDFLHLLRRFRPLADGSFDLAIGHILAVAGLFVGVFHDHPSSRQPDAPFPLLADMKGCRCPLRNRTCGFRFQIHRARSKMRPVYVFISGLLPRQSPGRPSAPPGSACTPRRLPAQR